MSITLVNPVKLRRTKAQFIVGTTIEIQSYDIQPDANLLRGLPSTLKYIPSFQVPEHSDEDGPYSELVVPDYFPPGSIVVFATQMEGIESSLDEFCTTGADEAFADLDLVDLNALLHRCDGEERDATGKVILGEPTARLLI